MMLRSVARARTAAVAAVEVVAAGGPAAVGAGSLRKSNSLLGRCRLAEVVPRVAAAVAAEA